MQGVLKLQERLAVLVVAAVLPLSVLSIGFAWREMDAARRLAQSQLHLAASLVAANQDRNVEAVDHLLAAAATTPAIRAADTRECRRYFESLRAHYPVYLNIGLADLSGKVVCHALSDRVFDISNRPDFQRVVSEKRFIMGIPGRGQRVGLRDVIPFGRPVLDGERPVGVVFASMDIERVASQLVSLHLPASVRVTLADPKGAIVMQYPPRPGARIGVPLANAQLRDAAQKMSAGEGEGEGEGGDATGQERLFAYVPTRAVAGDSLLAIVSLSRAQVTAPSVSSMRGELAALGATLLAGLLFAWWFGGRVIVAPTQQILATVRELERGRLDARVPISPGTQRGELARIGSAFNLMAESLQMRQQDLEAELRRNRQAYAVLDIVISNMHEALVAVTHTGQFLMFNEAAAHLFAIGEPMPLPPDWPHAFGIYHDDGITPCTFDELPMVLAAQGQSAQGVLYVVRNARVPEGCFVQCSWQPISGEGNVNGGLVVFTDVTPLKRLQADQAAQFAQLRQAQQALQELNASLEARIQERTGELLRQEKLFRALAEQAPEVVWNTDAQGQATFLNRAWYELVGGTPEDSLGFGWLRRVHPEDREEVAQKWLRSRETLQPYQGTRRLLAKDGTYHTMSYKAVPVLDETAQVAFWVGIDSDVSAFKAIEQALRTSNQELEAFSYSVSHDLRAPLGAIGGFSHALAAKLEGLEDDKAKHYLARIQAGVDKMDQLIEAMLALSRLARAPLAYAEVDITAAARESVEALRMQSPGRPVEVRVEEGLVARGDGRMLRVVLDNLIANAWKFTSKKADARIEVGWSAPDSAFFVRDNGVGFEMAYAGKLFGAFQRLHTDAEFPGTGIGLATVRRIVTRHHGKVWAQSVPAEGTTFYFTLADNAPPSWDAAAGAAGDAPAGS